MWKEQIKEHHKTKLIEKEIRFIVTRGRRWGVGELDEGSPKVQISSYKNKYQRGNVYNMTTNHTDVWYIWKLLRDWILRGLIWRKNKSFLFL